MPLSSSINSPKIFLTILIPIFLVLNGCGTLTSRWGYDPYEYHEYLNPSHAKQISSRIYSGLSWHVTAQQHCDGPYKLSSPCLFPSGMGFKGIWYFFLEAFATFDFLFLSTVGDTVILPLTILETCCTGDLSNAAAQGDLELVQKLLEAGADVNHTDVWGHTPLISACWGGHKDIVEVLLKHGADVNETSSGGRTPVYFAKKVGHPEIVELLVAAGATKPEEEEE